MVKASNPPSSKTPYLAVVVIFVLVVIGLTFLYVQSAAEGRASKSNYTALQSNYNTQTSQLNSANSALAAISIKYNTTEYNLTHPYTEVLYYQHTINLPKYNTTYTFNATGYNSYTGLYSGFTYNYTVTWGSFNTSFNAPYAGYLIFNGTSTIENIPSPSTCVWLVYVSTKLGYRNVSTTKSYLYNTTYTYVYHYPGNDGLFINLTSAPFTELCPLQAVTYDIPVSKGENYLVIDSENSTQGQTVTFSVKYVGLHTS
jgi:hypothetical protein